MTRLEGVGKLLLLMLRKVLPLLRLVVQQLSLSISTNGWLLLVLRKSGKWARCLWWYSRGSLRRKKQGDFVFKALGHKLREVVQKHEDLKQNHETCYNKSNLAGENLPDCMEGQFTFWFHY